MLQSCGRSRVLQSASENSGTSAPGQSLCRNFQPKSKLSRILCAVVSYPDCAWLAPMNEDAETTAAVLTAPLSSWRRLRGLGKMPSCFIVCSLEREEAL